MTPHLEVRNWKKLQHYQSGRNNVWIKLYSQLLDDLKRGDIALDEVTQAHLLKLWLVALRFRNHLPLDPDVLRYEISARQPIDFSTLIGGNYLLAKGLTKEEAIARMARQTTDLRDPAINGDSTNDSKNAILNKKRREEILGERSKISLPEKRLGRAAVSGASTLRGGS